MKKQIVFPLSFVAAAMLFAALAPGWPYGFFTMLRFVVTSTSVAIFIWAMDRSKSWLLWTHGVMAVLFNPIAKVHLNRDTWQVIDLIAGVLMATTAVTIYRTRS